MSRVVLVGLAGAHLVASFASPAVHYANQAIETSTIPTIDKVDTTETEVKYDKRQLKLISMQITRIITRSPDIELLKTLSKDDVVVSTPVVLGSGASALLSLGLYFSAIKGTVLKQEVTNTAYGLKVKVLQQSTNQFVSYFAEDSVIEVELHVALDPETNKIVMIKEGSAYDNPYIERLFHPSRIINTFILSLFQ